MKNRTLPNDEEWNKIINDAFLTEDCHAFSSEYNSRKELLMKGNNRDNMKKHNDRKYIRIIAATAAAVAIVPTSVFAYNKISSGPSSSISKTAKYQNTIEIQNPTSKAQNESEVSETADSSVSTQTMKIEFGWLPQDLVLQDDNTAFGGKYKNTAMGGMTPMFFKVSKGKNIKYNMKNSNDFEEYETSSQQITINYRTTYDAATASPNNFGREVWVCFKNAPYAANLFFTDDISNDDVKKIAENMTLTPTDRELYQDYQSQEENTDEQIAVPVENKVDMSDIKLYKTGETYVESEANYSVKLNDAHIQNNFDGIATDGSGSAFDYSNITDPLENIRTWYKSGDGVNSIDEKTKSMAAPLHILVTNLSYKNTSDKQEDICISPTMLTFENDIPYRTFSVPSTYGDYFNDSINFMNCEGSHFSFFSTKSSQKNHISLKPGESADVQLAYCVDDSMLGNIYLECGYSLCSASTYSYSIKNGAALFDLTNIK